jgi:hypothetical protein
MGQLVRWSGMQLLYVAFLQSFGCTRHFPAGISSVPDRLKIYGEKIQVIPKRDTHSGKKISGVPSVSSVHVELDDRLQSIADRTDVTTKAHSPITLAN